MFFWLIVLFAVAWGLLDWELGLLHEQKQAQERSKPVARPTPPAPAAPAAAPAVAAVEDKSPEAVVDATPAAVVEAGTAPDAGAAERESTTSEPSRQ